MEQSCLKIPFSFLQFKNKAKNAIFWSKIHFFRNVARFARKLLSIRKLLLTHSKLVGTPCISMSNNYSPLYFKTPRLDVINYPLRFINWESQTSPIQTQFKFFECCPPRLIIARFWLILKACWLVSVSADEGGYAVCKWHLSE